MTRSTATAPALQPASIEPTVQPAADRRFSRFFRASRFWAAEPTQQPHDVADGDGMVDLADLHRSSKRVVSFEASESVADRAERIERLRAVVQAAGTTVLSEDASAT